ncbi:MAG: prepilin-type N-terminal cleavage/methylation domain-containing protein, partial [Thauera phenolivorans]|nr:prepilin-type N-terminal cleavage/methylation domain-containing protein [Thauera phenolivorans]
MKKVQQGFTLIELMI